MEFCFSTPRITMHKWRASMITPTPLRRQLLFEGLRDLAGEALLNLQATGVHVHEPRDFAQPHYFLVGEVGHVALPEEGQQVMLAQAVDLDILHHDHFVVADAEHGAVQNGVGVLAIAAGEKP